MKPLVVEAQPIKPLVVCGTTDKACGNPEREREARAPPTEGFEPPEPFSPSLLACLLPRVGVEQRGNASLSPGDGGTQIISIIVSLGMTIVVIIVKPSHLQPP